MMVDNTNYFELMEMLSDQHREIKQLKVDLADAKIAHKISREQVDKFSDSNSKFRKWGKLRDISGAQLRRVANHTLSELDNLSGTGNPDDFEARVCRLENALREAIEGWDRVTELMSKEK